MTGSSGTTSEEVKALVRSGLLYAEAGEYRQALQVWAVVAEKDPECMVAIHCTEILKNYLDSIYSGADAILPDLRSQITDLGFGFEEDDPIPGPGQAKEPKKGSSTGVMAALDQLIATGKEQNELHDRGILNDKAENTLIGFGDMAAEFDSEMDAGGFPSINLESPVVESDSLASALVEHAGIMDEGGDSAVAEFEPEIQSTVESAGLNERSDDIALQSEVIDWGAEQQPTDDGQQDTQRPVKRHVTPRYAAAEPPPPIHRRRPTGPKSTPMKQEEPELLAAPADGRTLCGVVDFDKSAQAEQGEQEFGPWGGAEEFTPWGDSTEEVPAEPEKSDEEEIYELEFSSDDVVIGSESQVSVPEDEVDPIRDPFQVLRLRMQSSALSDGDVLQQSPNDEASNGTVFGYFSEQANPDTPSRQGMANGMNDVELGGFAAKAENTAETAKPVPKSDPGEFAPPFSPSTDWDRSGGDEPELTAQNSRAPVFRREEAISVDETLNELGDDELWERARRDHSLGDFNASQSAIELILMTNPHHQEALKLRVQNLDRLESQFLSKLRSMDHVPELALGEDQLIWQNLDAKRGFLLSRVDGELTVRDLIDIIHFSRLETMKLLAEFVTDGILTVE